MKIISWSLIACKILAVSCGLIFLNSGCSDQSGTTGGEPSAAEKKWDDETRNAMQAASQSAKKK